MTRFFKKLGRLTAAICAITLMMTVLPVGLFDAQAASSTVEPTIPVLTMVDVDGKDVVETQTATYEYEDVTLDFTTTYPIFVADEETEGNDKIIAKLNKATYKTFYSECIADMPSVCETYASLGITGKVIMESEYGWCSRMGNIFSIGAYVYTTIEEYGVTIKNKVIQNFNLTTGKRIASLDRIFANVDGLKGAIIEEIKEQVAKLAASDEWDIYEEIDWDVVAEQISISQMNFAYGIAQISLPGQYFSPTVFDTLTFVFSKDIVKRYLKNEKLVETGSSYVIALPMDIRTGCFWEYERIMGDDCCSPMGAFYVDAAVGDVADGVDGNIYRYIIAKAPGSCSLKVRYYTPEGEGQDYVVYNVTVDEDLRMTVVEGERVEYTLEELSKRDVDEVETVRFMSNEYGDFSEYICKEKTVTYDTGSIYVSAQYPKLLVDEYSSEDRVTAIENACQKAFYTELIQEAKQIYADKGYKEGDHADLFATATYCNQGRMGNLLSIQAYVEIYREDGTVETNYYKTVNIDLRTNKRITSLGSIFRDVNALKDKIIEYAKEQIALSYVYYPEESEFIKKNIDWKAVRKSIDIDSLTAFYPFFTFSADIGTIYEDSFNTMHFTIPPSVLEWCIKPENYQLLWPESSSVINLGVDLSQGYWIVESEEDSCVRAYRDVIFEVPLYDITDGIEYGQAFFISAIEPGTTTLTFHYCDLMGNITYTMDYDVTVLDNMMLITPGQIRK